MNKGRLPVPPAQVASRFPVPPTFNASLPQRRDFSLAGLPQEQAARLLRSWLDVASLLGVPLHLAQIEAVKAVNRELGLDYRHLLAYSQAQVAAPARLGDQRGLKVSSN